MIENDKTKSNCQIENNFTLWNSD